MITVKDHLIITGAFMKKEQFAKKICVLLVLLVILTGCPDPMESNESSPEIPTNVNASATSQTNIRITWSSISNADGYRIFKSESSTGDFIEIGASTANTYNDSNLTPHSTHFYKVSAYNKHGESSLSGYVSATATLISAPTNVRVTTVTSSSINIAWDSVQNATGYRVYRRTGETGDFTPASALTTTSLTNWTNSSLDAETKYYYRVKARNASSESDFSEIVSASTSMAIPAVPSNVTAAANSTSSITISWSLVPNAEGYRVYRNNSSVGNFTLIKTTEEVLFIDTDLETFVNYFYKITAYNAAGESAESFFASARTHPAIPGKPAIWSTAGEPLYIIFVDWPLDPTAEGYRIFRSNTADGEYNVIGTTIGFSASSFSDIVGTPNTTYYYKVSAYNISGESEKSDPRAGTSLPTTPGLTWQDAIQMDFSISSTSVNKFGYFPDGADVVWYSFVREIGTTTLYAEDNAFSSNFTGDIVIDLWFKDYLGTEYILTLNGEPATNIDLGGGSNSPHSLILNWNTLSGLGTVYVSVRPKNNLPANKGTFSFYHKR
jgi:fibronectin type 3 domain-containing protein